MFNVSFWGYLSHEILSEGALNVYFMQLIRHYAGKESYLNDRDFL
jgi:hypothetical protein